MGGLINGWMGRLMNERMEDGRIFEIISILDILNHGHGIVHI